jgi:hypothetical protein
MRLRRQKSKKALMPGGCPPGGGQRCENNLAGLKDNKLIALSFPFLRLCASAKTPAMDDAIL